MTRSFARRIAIFINGLFIFSLMLVNLGTINPERVVHELQHEKRIEHAASHHLLISHASHDDDAEHPFTVSEHQMLHSIDQLQFFPYPLVADTLIAVLPGAAPVKLIIQSIPISTFDPPFRPPRFISTLV